MITLKEEEIETTKVTIGTKIRKKNREFSSEDDFPANVNEYGDELYNPDGTPYNRRSSIRKRGQFGNQD